MTIDQEYYAFIDWLKSQSGGKSLLAPGADNYKQSTLYLLWKKAGKPSASPVAGAFNEPSAETTPAWLDPGPETITRGGWMYTALRDPSTGKIVTYEPLGRAEDTDLAREQLDLQKQKWQAEDFTTRQQLAVQEERNRQARLSNQLNQYNQAFMGRSEQDIADQVRNQMAGKYEEWRRSLGDLSGARDWIKQWGANRPNPYAQPLQSGEGQKNALADAKAWEAKNKALFDKAQTGVENAGAAWDALAGRVTDNGQGVPDNPTLEAAKARYEAAVEQRNALEAQQNAAQQPGGTTTRQPGPSNEQWQEQYGTEVPSWLPKFVPELANQQFLWGPASVERTKWGTPYGVGTRTGKFDVAPPSGQQWQATPTSVKQGLAGYMDWTGQSYGDTLDRMNMMLPDNPSRIPTAWAPRR